MNQSGKVLEKLDRFLKSYKAPKNLCFSLYKKRNGDYRLEVYGNGWSTVVTKSNKQEGDVKQNETR